MIPFAILGGKVKSGADEMEIRILELSPGMFTFRLAAGYSEDWIRGICSIEFRFDGFDNAHALQNYEIEEIGSFPFWREIRVRTSDPVFAERTRELIRSYTGYIDLKLDGDDAGVSEELTRYPRGIEERFPESFEGWKRELAGNLCGEGGEDRPACASGEALREDREGRRSGMKCSIRCPDGFYIELNQWKFREHFLQLSKRKFLAFYRENSKFEGLALWDDPFRGVVIGNQFCPEMLPGREDLEAVIRKAEEEELEFIVAFPPLRERDLPKVRGLLEMLCEISDSRPELILNDWGLAAMIAEEFPGRFALTLGVLLNRRRKDVRLNYRKDAEQMYELLGENSSNAEHYTRFLRETYGITGFYQEACGYPYRFAQGRNLFAFPYFQMNTATKCTLFAACRNGARGRQTETDGCPGYCAERSFLYPSGLKMVGRFNSLFGFDGRILCDSGYGAHFLDQNPEKMLLNFV